MGGVILRGRPTPLEGALVVPKHYKLDRMARIERSLQPATSAIWVLVSDLLSIISWISSCWDSARFGAILDVWPFQVHSRVELLALTGMVLLTFRPDLTTEYRNRICPPETAGAITCTAAVQPLGGLAEQHLYKIWWRKQPYSLLTWSIDLTWELPCNDYNGCYLSVQFHPSLRPNVR